MKLLADSGIPPAAAVRREGAVHTATIGLFGTGPGTASPRSGSSVSSRMRCIRGGAGAADHTGTVASRATYDIDSIITPGRPFVFVPHRRVDAAQGRADAWQRQWQHTLAAAAHLAHAGGVSGDVSVMLGTSNLRAYVHDSLTLAQIDPNDVLAAANATISVEAGERCAVDYDVTEMPALHVGATGSTVAIDLAGFRWRDEPLRNSAGAGGRGRLLLLGRAPGATALTLALSCGTPYRRSLDALIDATCAAAVAGMTMDGLGYLELCAPMLPLGQHSFRICFARRRDGGVDALYLGAHGVVTNVA